MANLAGSRCFAKFRKNILTLTQARTSAQSVVKSVVIPKVSFHPFQLEMIVALTPHAKSFQLPSYLASLTVLLIGILDTRTVALDAIRGK